MPGNRWVAMGTAELGPIGRSDAAVLEQLHEVRSIIDVYGRSDITIVAVTKGFDRSAIECASRLGLVDIGENYAQELLAKAPMPDGTVTHFIGRIQRNKVRKIADHVSLWHSVSRPEVIAEIGRRQLDGRALIQISAPGDDTKDGADPKELDSLLSTAEEHGVKIQGLMTIGVHGDRERTRDAFGLTAELAQRYQLRELSMGMSGDYRDAVAAGATILRLGSLLFGPRPTR